MKIVTIVGARPQFIKAAALSRILRRRKDVHEIIIHTGQHFDANMSKIFFEQMDIPHPDYNLEISGLPHGAMTGRMLEKIEQVLIEEKPDRLLVYGDTNSTLAGALAASKLHIPVAHVESGLRSFNMRMPEEINRIMADRLSDKLFCPTDTAMQNLKNEGFGGFKQVVIIKSGDVMLDAALFYSTRAHKPEIPIEGVSIENPFGLVTLHRAENTDDPQRLREILSALIEVSQDLPLLMPLHPRTRKKIDSAAFCGDQVTFDRKKLCFIDPVGYLEMVYLLQQCSLVLTDSGGLQKEAYFFKKPCITLRPETEWVELIESGYNSLAGSDKSMIVREAARMKNVIVCDDVPLYGSGHACERIVETLVK